ncbi:acyl-CoA dehydrogenase [soil metagenome]
MSSSYAAASHPRPWPAGNPELVSFLPLIYVAWADGDLSPGELERIRDYVRDEKTLSSGSLEVLESWLQPDTPPSASALAGLRDRIREVARSIPAGERRSLARLGAALARSEGESGSSEGGVPGELWGTERGMRTLAGVEELLGVLGGESARALLEGETPLPDASDTATESPAAFDVHRMRRLLDGPWGEIRGRVLAFLEEPDLAPTTEEQASGEPMSAHRERTYRGLRLLADQGLGLVAYPERVGGGGDVAGSIIVFETLGYGDLSLLIKYGVQFGLFGGSIYQLGTRRHHDAWLGAVGRLDLPGCYAMTEVNHGSNVRDLETVARYLPDEDVFEIHTPHPGARKDWIGNAAEHGHMATVFAQLHVPKDGTDEEHGVHAFLVPLRDDEGKLLEGIRIEDCGLKVGLNGVDNGRIAFDRVRIPRANLLNRFGDVSDEGLYESPIPSSGRRFFTMLGTLVTGRISLASAAVSAGKTALAISIPYSATRRQFGPSGAPEVPVLDYLTQQRLLLPRLAESYALHFAVRDLIRTYDDARSGQLDRSDAAKEVDEPADLQARLEVSAAGLKAYASRHAVDTIQASREACGGRGYLAENRFGELRRDIDIFTTFEGANVVLLQLVAKGLLSRYREEMGDLNLRTMVRYVADRAGAEATRRNPVRSRRTSPDHLRDPGTHLEAFQFRESRLLHTVARRLKGMLDDGVDSFEAMNRCQDHLVTLALAHTETEILERFHEAAAEAPKAGGVRERLTTLAALWALWRLEADRAWFLAAGYMEAQQTRAIRALVNELCRELHPDAVALVEAFGIPDGVLRAPAAFGAPEHPTSDAVPEA